MQLVHKPERCKEKNRTIQNKAFVFFQFYFRGTCMCIGMCVFSCHVDCFFFFFYKPIKYITPLNAIINSYMLNFGHACVCIAILLSYRRVGGKKTSELWCSFIILSQLVKRSILFLPKRWLQLSNSKNVMVGLYKTRIMTVLFSVPLKKDLL